MEDKKGLSGVIITIILIGLSLVIVIIVWNVVNSLVNEKLTEAESCFNVFEKAELNSQYTCYKSSGEIQFSINIGESEVESILVSIIAKGEGRSFTITDEGGTIENVANYESTGFGTDLIKLPGKNSGSTYVYDWGSILTSEPDSVRIAPKIDGNQCGVADTISSFGSCELIH